MKRDHGQHEGQNGEHGKKSGSRLLPVRNQSDGMDDLKTIREVGKRLDVAAAQELMLCSCSTSHPFAPEFTGTLAGKDAIVAQRPLFSKYIPTTLNILKTCSE